MALFRGKCLKRMKCNGQDSFLGLLKENGTVINCKTSQNTTAFSELLSAPFTHRRAGNFFFFLKRKTSSSLKVTLIRVVILEL